MFINNVRTICRLAWPATFTLCLVKQDIRKSAGLLIINVEVAASEASVECMCQL